MNDPIQTLDDQRKATLPAPAESRPQPQCVGRYRVEKILGEGGFGLVYLAYDDQLQRSVAIKVPHRKLVARPEDAQAYLTEARIVAALDHPNIVPVYDVGSTEDFPFFVVSKFIEGSTLAKRIKDNRPSVAEATELVPTVAEALHYAHKQGLVHRDIKPGNILLDKSGKPFVADYGLALREQDIGKGPRFAGTPAYMSPEQARGEGHRVDGRSDIFGLGVVFYEMLTGRRPFKGDSQEELLEQITSMEVRPPRQWDDLIPKELERICIKALAKRASERYTTGKDMADDLRHFLSKASAVDKSTVTGRAEHEAEIATPIHSLVQTPADQHAIKIVPKGLRSFDAGDADFFLELLPGPRDREGLPENIRFWKSRIEETDAEKTFSVGLVYGPSGCGKSSLMKAGLLPRLSDDVIAVYVETTAEDTEARLLKGLRRYCPDVPENLGVIEAVAALRRGHFLPAGKKVVLVLDQFEQWLHAKREKLDTELVQALRHCEGERLQCIVMVRDDFWLAVSRFMKAMEIEILEGRNSALIDLFDLLHARKVLAEFGRAFGRLPDNLTKCTREQEAFLDQAVSGLAQEGKVISVRLSLFAEMVKGKPWTPATLKEVGGTEGVGVTFLEETFSASTAPPEHRYHQKAARAVLKALLPESGTDIKGHMRSQQELLEASGYASRPKDFDDLIRILDSEIRLITPTDPEGQERAEESTSQALSGQKYYQLTHDYLVPSLRDWLSRKQKETRRGRAELLLADRAAVWNARQENRQLPSLRQWLSIRWLTAKKNYTPQQRKMMNRAGRYHAVRGIALGLLLAVATVTGVAVIEQRNATKAAGLVQTVLNADTAQVPAILGEMAKYRKWADPLLREENDKAVVNSRPKLNVSLALLPVDPGQVHYLYDRLLEAAPNEVPVIRDALEPHKEALLDKLWTVVEKPEKSKEKQRLRAASALAIYDPESVKWAKVQDAAGNDLVNVPAVYLALWMDSLRPVRLKLLAPLSVVYADINRPVERSLATGVLADYAVDQPKVLANLVMDADVQQFAVFFPKLKDRGEQGLPVLRGEIDKKLPPDAVDELKEKLAKRQANAAVALLKLERPEKVWPLLKHSPDPRVRSYLIHRLHPLGADAAAIIERLDQEPDVTIRRALILSLGEYGEKELPPDARKAVLPKLQAIYRNDADPGLHAASEWLLRQWQRVTWLKQVNGEWAKDKEQRQKRLVGIERLITMEKEKTPPQWYVNGQGQTMVVIPGPVEFVMGSPLTEAGRNLVEVQHKKRIGRTFAVSAKPVTLAEYRRFDARYGIGEIEQYARTADSPVLGTSWYQAVAYCNWLSKQEGLPESEWCYEPVKGSMKMRVLAGSSVGLLSGSLGSLAGCSLGPLAATCGLLLGRTNPEYTEGMKLAQNYLHRKGYRLPTEAEMEYATRAGAVTARYYGETKELLENYAWYFNNSQERAWPVGSKKPNDIGLFDIQGNVNTWCQERSSDHSKIKSSETSEDKEDALAVRTADGRMVRGGSFDNNASNLRSANRDDRVPTYRELSIGFRLARTITP